MCYLKRVTNTVPLFLFMVAHFNFNLYEIN